MRNFLLLLSAVCLLTLTGCSTIDSRIKSNQALFDSLPAETQKKLREHVVEVGYTPAMVFIAIGDPDGRKDKITKDSSTQIWSYRERHDEYAGTGVSHYRRALVRDARTGRVYAIVQPVYADYYSEESQEVLRIEFKDGKVISIEKSE